MVDRYAKFSTENLLFAASRIEHGGEGAERGRVVTFSSRLESKRPRTYVRGLANYGSSTWARTRDLRINSPVEYSARLNITRKYTGHR
jgi:hypothetical protein